MTVSYLRYGLHNGFIHNWLSAGPQELAALTAEPEWWVDSQPVERGMLTEATFQVGAYQGAWGYTRCAEDHLVNQSGLRGTTAYLRSWAYTQLDCAEPMAVELRLVTPGPADVWINHEHVLRKESAAVRLPARLAQGTNEVLVRFETPTTGHYAQFMALQVCEPGGAPVSGDEGDAKGAPIMVQIPTVITPRLIPLRNKLEKLFAEIHLDRDVYERDQEIALLFPEDLSAEATVTIRLMNPARVIFADGMVEGKPGMRRRLNYAFELVGGGYQIELLPEVNDYYEQGMRIKHNLPLWTLGNAPYSTRPYGTFAERKQEALSKASEQKNNVYAELAKMALGWWKRVDAAAIRQAIARVAAKEENSLMDLAGLLGMVFRFADQEPFAPDLANEVMECALAYHYEATGQGAAQFLTATCETLAGQRWPNALFGEEGIPGQALYERGVEHITAWRYVGSADSWNGAPARN